MLLFLLACTGASTPPTAPTPSTAPAPATPDPEPAAVKPPPIDDQLFAWLGAHADTTVVLPIEIPRGVMTDEQAGVIAPEVRLPLDLDSTALSMTLDDHLADHCKDGEPCRVWIEGTWGPLMGETTADKPVFTVRKVVGPATGTDTAIRLAD